MSFLDILVTPHAQNEDFPWFSFHLFCTFPTGCFLISWDRRRDRLCLLWTSCLVSHSSAEDKTVSLWAEAKQFLSSEWPPLPTFPLFFFIFATCPALPGVPPFVSKVPWSESAAAGTPNCFLLHYVQRRLDREDVMEVWLAVCGK